MGFILFYFYLWNRIYELSLNLSANQKMESKVKIESAFITNVQYSIKVYHLLRRENRIKSEMENKWRQIVNKMANN